MFSRAADPQICKDRYDHGEPDTTITVHALHALNRGHNQVLTGTVDTDIVVIIIGLFNELLSLHPYANFWI